MEEEKRAKNRQIFIDIFGNDLYMNKLFHDGGPWHIETSPGFAVQINGLVFI